MIRRRMQAHRSPVYVTRHLAVVTLISLAGAAAAAAQATVDVERLGPQPGIRVPDFSAIDQAGAARSLDSVLGPKGAMLVFSRSADW